MQGAREEKSRSVRFVREEFRRPSNTADAPKNVQRKRSNYQATFICRTRNQYMTKTKQGRFFEIIASQFLQLHQVRIIKQNVRTPHGEIDLIGCFKKVLCFIEVRSKKTPVEFNWQLIVSHVKLQRILSAIEHINHELSDKNMYIDYRLDLVFICTSKQTISWIQGILQNNH